MNNKDLVNRILTNRSVCLIKEACGEMLEDKAYVCGGAIRNVLMGKPDAKDVDLFTNLPKERFEAVVEQLKKIGRVEYGQYGAPRLYINNEEPYIDVVPFINFSGYGYPIDTIDGLLMNFDFTANAIGVNISTGEVYNPVNGIEDIERRILSAVRTDFPEMPVSDKIPLSAVSVFWFRLLHYQKKLGFEFDEATEQWIVENKFRVRDKEMFVKYFFEPQMGERMRVKLG
jgi:hypothetical protein